MELYMWSLHVTGRERVHPAIWQAAERLESEHGIVCGEFRKRDLQREVTRFLGGLQLLVGADWALCR